MSGDIAVPNNTGWVPVRRGDTYCSPRCGCGCTWADYQQAMSDAAALCDRLGLGWSPRVWENGGWYHEAKRGHARVLPNRHNGEVTTYTCFLNLPSHQFLYSCGDPLEAYVKAVAQARQYLMGLYSQLQQKVNA